MQKRWGNLLRNDPAYSPNLTLNHEDFSYAWPPRVKPMNFTECINPTYHEYTGDLTRLKGMKKMVFIHVAKTAGTSVKKFFLGNFASAQCEAALERNPEWIKHGRLDGIDQLQFVSGHISYAQLESRIDLSHFLVVTCIRNPLEHIVSHIAHFRRLAEKKYRDQFDASSEEIQLLVLKLAKLDLASPEAIAHLYKNMTNHELLLFDNCQTRYFTKGFSLGPNGQRVGFKELEFALQTLKKIDLVGDTHELQTFLGAVSQHMGWNLPVHLPKENFNNEKYGMDIRNPAMVNALLPFVHYDMELYSQRAEFLCSSSIA